MNTQRSSTATSDANNRRVIRRTIRASLQQKRGRYADVCFHMGALSIMAGGRRDRSQQPAKP